jgi:predicted DNA-binding transcriptional regulator YafY
VQKVLAVLPADVRRREELLASRVYTLGEQAPGPVDSISDTVCEAVATGRVLTVDYVAADGATTRRDVEPMGLLWGPFGWYLVAWCRLRDAVRGFQPERMRAVTLRDERAPLRERELAAELDRLEASPLEM